MSSTIRSRRIVEFFDARLADADRYGVRDRCILDPGPASPRRNWPWEERYLYQKSVYTNLDALRRFGLPLYVALPWKRTAQHDELLEIVVAPAARVRARRIIPTGSARWSAGWASALRPRRRRHALMSSWPEGVDPVGRAASRPIRRARSGATSASGASTNRRSAKPRVRDRQLGVVDRDVVEEQQVDVERAWTPAHDALAQRRGLDPLAAPQQRERIERRARRRRPC